MKVQFINILLVMLSLFAGCVQETNTQPKKTSSPAPSSSTPPTKANMSALGSFTISSISSPNSTSLQVNFGASSNATSYTLKYGTTSGVYGITVSTNAVSPATISGLAPGSTYYVMVTANNASGSKNANAQLSGATQAAPVVAPVLPGSFAISSISSPNSTSLQVNFGASSNATSYTLKYGTTSGVYGTTVSTNAVSPATISGLAPGSTYYVMVVAKNANGSKNASSELSATTQVLTTPPVSSPSLSLTESQFLINDLEVLNVNKPNWPLKTISYHLNKAHPNMTYNMRIQVQGGEYPYFFKPLIPLPDGMTLDSTRGEINWKPNSSQLGNQKISIQIIDQNKKTLNFDHTINVSATGFVFISQNLGLDTNSQNGSIEKPFKTLNYALSKKFPADSIYVFRAGVYNEKFRINSVASFYMAYPDSNEKVILDGKGDTILDVNDVKSGLFQGFEMRNSNYFMICMDGENVEKVVIRKNKMHSMNVGAAGNNEGFLFTFDRSSYRTSDSGYREIVFQENDISNKEFPGDRAAGLVLYDVGYSLFEDNNIHDMESANCFIDKDDGYYNTIRGNICNKTLNGLRLINQYSQSHIDVHHNLIKISSQADGGGIQIGQMDGYIEYIYVHHNTIINQSVFLSWVLGSDNPYFDKNGVLQPKSSNINVYRNVYFSDNGCPYSIGYGNVANVIYNKQRNIKFDGNMFIATEMAICGDGGPINNGTIDFTNLQKIKYEEHSLKLKSLDLDMYYKIPETSPYYRIFGY